MLPLNTHITLGDIARRIEYINQIADDDETAHGEEDDLWKDVLFAIANGQEDPQELAKAAIQTITIEFERWY